MNILRLPTPPEPKRRLRARSSLVLAAACAAASLTYCISSSSASAAPGDTHTEAAQKGVDFLSPDVVGFTDANGCIACHRQGAALYGLSLAKGAGFMVDLDQVSGVPHIASAIVDDQQPAGYWDWGGPNDLKSSYNFYGLAGYDAYVATAYSNDLVEAADWAISAQQPDGRWWMDFEDGVAAHGDMTVTGRFMVGIAQAKQRVDPAKAAQYQAALDAAVDYIATHEDDSSDITGVGYVYELSWALIGAKAAGLHDDDPIVSSLVADLQARQSSLGFAWGQTSGEGPDVFDSGMAIYALCKAGVPAIGNAPLQSALDWVNQQQGADGSWGNDISTTFAILGLSCYGDYGVIVSNSGAVTHVLSSNSPNAQDATYDFDVQNHGFIDDTYDLSVVGGMPGWSGAVPSSISIPAGAHASITLTVHAPPNLPEALPVEMTVVATSEAVPTLSASARITTFTDPPPPTSGDSTTVQIVSGAGADVTLASTQTLSATVRDATTSAPVVGPGKGVVTFFVAGLAVATDTDADGDGVFSVPFTPDCGWTALGPQDLRAIYSGIDLPGDATDLLSSLSSATITLTAPLCCPKPETCNGLDDDCDGVADDGNPGGGASCDAGLLGACQTGTLTCVEGGIECVPALSPGQSAERCNGVDDDCNGVIDDGFDVGATCTVGLGQCAAVGTIECAPNGSSVCSAVAGTPSQEICGDDLDSDCDGNDDNGCACTSDDACGGPSSGEICDIGQAPGHSFTCVLGCRGTGNGCGTGLHCTSEDEGAGECVACLEDADCGGAASGIVCDVPSHTCIAGCRGEDGNGCGEGLSCTSSDDSIGSCIGCDSDADCGGATSGVICDAGSKTCEKGCRGEDGNGCGDGMMCTSSTSGAGECIPSPGIQLPKPIVQHGVYKHAVPHEDPTRITLPSGARISDPEGRGATRPIEVELPSDEPEVTVGGGCSMSGGDASGGFALAVPMAMALAGIARRRKGARDR